MTSEGWQVRSQTQHQKENIHPLVNLRRFLGMFWRAPPEKPSHHQDYDLLIYTVFGSKRIPTNQPKKFPCLTGILGVFIPRYAQQSSQTLLETAVETVDPAIPRRDPSLHQPQKHIKTHHGEPWLWADGRCPTRSKAQSCPSPTSCLSIRQWDGVFFNDLTMFFSGGSPSVVPLKNKQKWWNGHLFTWHRRNTK